MRPLRSVVAHRIRPRPVRQSCSESEAGRSARPDQTVGPDREAGSAVQQSCPRSIYERTFGIKSPCTPCSAFRALTCRERRVLGIHPLGHCSHPRRQRNPRRSARRGRVRTAADRDRTARRPRRSQHLHVAAITPEGANYGGPASLRQRLDSGAATSPLSDRIGLGSPDRGEREGSTARGLPGPALRAPCSIVGRLLGEVAASDESLHPSPMIGCNRFRIDRSAQRVPHVLELLGLPEHVAWRSHH
jgi:hypothetical protein